VVFVQYDGYNQPCDANFSFSEILKFRNGQTITYFEQDRGQNQWAIPVDMYSYAYFGFGPRWFIAEGEINRDCHSSSQPFKTHGAPEFFTFNRYHAGYYHPFQDSALNRYNVPFLLGEGSDQYGNALSKTQNRGMNCTDCSGLVVWSLLQNDVNLHFPGSSREIVNSVNADKLLQICREHYYTDIPINSWVDGNLIFLDVEAGSGSAGEGVPDHVMFWAQDYDQVTFHGWVIHARGGATRHSNIGPELEQGKVVFQPLPEFYLNLYQDGAFIPMTSTIP
jgi:hypothetical protein